jgi:alkanesulfonate monooxygenase SsuD/methylene tetrahydromethanopterin reductase-like flavin-dependent oxidoreductase (luciferase family)
MKVGLALPQYDFSVAGADRLGFETIVEYARVAARAGADSVWLSDHLFFDLAKYGGSPARAGCYDPLVTLAALARQVPDVRIGTLVMCEALRPATVLTKALATLDRISSGRLDVGLGAGWYAPEYEAIGMTMPPPGARLDRLVEALDIVRGMIGGTPHRAQTRFNGTIDARNLPGSLQQPAPRIFAGGKGDRLLRVVASHSDGWNTCWVWTPDAYRERVETLDRACEAIDRDPRSVWRSLGLYGLCGENERDLERRFARLVASSPAGVLADDLASFREGRLVGTVDDVQEQVRGWEALGVETLVVGVGAVPFQASTVDDVELVLHACATA